MALKLFEPVGIDAARPFSPFAAGKAARRVRRHGAQVAGLSGV